jgi:hypothetical protein
MEELTINAGVLLELLAGACVAVAGNKDKRPHLSAVQLTVKRDTVRAAGTNGFKLAYGEYKLPSSEYSFGVLFPATELKNVLTLLKAHKRDNVTVSENGIFRVAGNVIAATPLSSNYPDIDNIIPAEWALPTGAGVPALSFNPVVLSDMAKIPNTSKRVNIYFNYEKFANLAVWDNDTGVSWRYVFMRLKSA